MTYRHRGHSVADAGLAYRDKEEIAEHQRHDPVDRAAVRLAELGVLDGSDVEALREHAEQRVREAVEFAERSPEPDLESLGEHVYGDPGSSDQVARMASGAPFGETDLLLRGGPRS